MHILARPTHNSQNTKYKIRQRNCLKFHIQIVAVAAVESEIEAEIEIENENGLQLPKVVAEVERRRESEPKLGEGQVEEAPMRINTQKNRLETMLLKKYFKKILQTFIIFSIILW